MDLKKTFVALTVVCTAGLATNASARQHQGTASPPSACTTVKPGPDWVCVNGGWLPPGMPLPTGGQVAAPAPVSTAACTTPRPGPDWVCADGGWFPPGMPLPDSVRPAPAAPAALSSGCTTVQPGPNWACVNGGWLPPGMTPAAAPTAAPASSARSTPASADTGGRLRVMTWNIHFGHGDPWGQAHAIARSGADVVLLQEASTWDEPMPATYAERLRQITGQPWQSAWGPSAPGASGSQGTLILSRLPIVDATAAVLDGTGTVRALIDVGGVHVNVFSIHLEWSDTSRRSSQLEQFLGWSRQFGGARLAGGDFNAWWGEWWIGRMEHEYSDTWQDVTGSDENGYTLNGAVRFDYLFRSYDENWRLTPTSCWVEWTGLSDHAAVVADYTVR